MKLLPWLCSVFFFFVFTSEPDLYLLLAEVPAINMLLCKNSVFRLVVVVKKCLQLSDNLNTNPATFIKVLTEGLTIQSCQFNK